MNSGLLFALGRDDRRSRSLIAVPWYLVALPMQQTLTISQNSPLPCDRCFEYILACTPKDFWTVRCTRCPDALDKLEKMAKDPKYANTKFASICLGAPEEGCDVTREILETPDDAPRWDAIHHFFMDFKSKEKAKKILGFSSVPFYIFLNEEGEIEQTGNTKAINFDRIPGVEKKDDPVIIPVANVDSSGERVLILDEDF